MSAIFRDADLDSMLTLNRSKKLKMSCMICPYAISCPVERPKRKVLDDISTRAICEATKTMLKLNSMLCNIGGLQTSVIMLGVTE